MLRFAFFKPLSHGYKAYYIVCVSVGFACWNFVFGMKYWGITNRNFFLIEAHVRWPTLFFIVCFCKAVSLERHVCHWTWVLPLFFVVVVVLCVCFYFFFRLIRLFFYPQNVESFRSEKFSWKRGSQWWILSSSVCWVNSVVSHRMSISYV